PRPEGRSRAPIHVHACLAVDLDIADDLAGVRYRSDRGMRAGAMNGVARRATRRAEAALDHAAVGKRSDGPRVPYPGAARAAELAAGAAADRSAAGQRFDRAGIHDPRAASADCAGGVAGAAGAAGDLSAVGERRNRPRIPNARAARAGAKEAVAAVAAD